MKYCVRCLYPETKPRLWFNEDGLCSACINFDKREAVDWEIRAKSFDDIVRRGWPWGGKPQVIVPVSGGKDSTAQVAKCLDMGYNVLAVNARTDLLTPIGRRNLDNIGRLVDLVEFHPRDDLRYRIMRLALKEIGDWSWPEHVLIHTVPFRAATRWGISTIVFGELSQDEYGAGPIGSENYERMTRRWVEEFAGLNGLRVSDVQGHLAIDDLDIAMYTFPSQSQLAEAHVNAVWLGKYFPWDGYENFKVAERHGFEALDGHVDGSLYGYENIDNFATGARDYLRYAKFGYGRATDIASNHIRRGRLTRSEAISLIRGRDGAFPWTYLGKPLGEICQMIGLTLDDFIDAVDTFTNKELFALSLSDPVPKPLFELS